MLSGFKYSALLFNKQANNDCCFAAALRQVRTLMLLCCIHVTLKDVSVSPLSQAQQQPIWLLYELLPFVAEFSKSSTI